MNFERLRERVQLANDARYFIMRDLNPDMEIDEEIENRRTEDKNEGYSELSGVIYSFKENFLKLKGTNPFSKSISDYKEDALTYLKCSYPFCFNIDIIDHYPSLSEADGGIPEDYLNYGMYIAYYAMALGADDEKIKGIGEFLKNKKLTQIRKKGKIERSHEEPYEGYINLDNIQGSTIEYYQADNLLEVLNKVNDKGIGRYMEYVMRQGGFAQFGKAFDGLCVEADENNNLFVSEGNHRLVGYQVLKTVREYVTGEKIDGLMVEGSISKMKIIPKAQDEWEF